jgi:hypothetical protein
MIRAAPYRPGTGDRLHAAAVALVLFALYAATAPREVAMEDDGLFVLSSYFLGIEHPPGYPLFTLAGHLFSRLPFGSIAYRVHLTAALFGGLACGVLWLVVRQLVAGRLPAYLAALGLGLSPVFWSQANIAEVYTLNTLFLFSVLYLAFRAAPLEGPAAGRWVLPALAATAGMSLANHYPLMLLTAPGIAVLLWPCAADIRRRFLLLAPLFMLGVLPYVWLVVRSWAPLEVSFYGPLESWREILYFLARSGYAGVDHSATAGLVDHLNFLIFFWREFFVQFALAGSLLAVAGFVAQWRVWGTRVALGLTLAFLGPSVVLLFILGFDYDGLYKHVFHVYPLPAYGIGAIWMALGFAQLREKLRPAVAAAACGALLAAILGLGLVRNLHDESEWVARYAKTMMDALPKDAIVVARGEWDLVPMAYYHLLEGRRPDLTLIHPTGLTLGNRMFHPLRITEEGMKKVLRRNIEAERGAVAFSPFAESYFTEWSRTNHWLYLVLDHKPGNAATPGEVPESFVRFFEQDVLHARAESAWDEALQGELRRQYARLLAAREASGKPLGERDARDAAALAEDYYGALGLLEGMIGREKGYVSADAQRLLERVRVSMPSDPPKAHQARYFELRAFIRVRAGDSAGAIEDLQTSVAILPVRDNNAVGQLKDLLKQKGDTAALQALEARLKR